MFLHHRTDRASTTDARERAAAVDLAAEPGYVPLSLGQAGANLAAQQTRFEDDLASYRQRQLKLLECGRPIVESHLDFVAATWSISFSEVERPSPVAPDSLWACAFLSPGAIPIEILLDGAEDLGAPLAAVLEEAALDPLVLDEFLALSDPRLLDRAKGGIANVQRPSARAGSAESESRRRGASRLGRASGGSIELLLSRPRIWKLSALRSTSVARDRCRAAGQSAIAEAGRSESLVGAGSLLHLPKSTVRRAEPLFR